MEASHKIGLYSYSFVMFLGVEEAATNGLPDTAGARSLSHQWHHHECNLEIKHGEVMSSQFEIPESQIFEIFQLAT